MGWRRAFLVVALLAAVVILGCLGVVAWRLIDEGPAGIHQASITREMAGWEREYRSVSNWREAWQAAEMLEYVRVYYVPGPGYRGNARRESELEDQRARTREAIATGLREFTGQDFGTDADRWREWLRQQGHGEGK